MCVFVGATIGRPQILQSKICRRKAKIRLFSFGKSEKRSFSAGERGSPLQFFPESGFFDSLQSPEASASGLLFYIIFFRSSQKARTSSSRVAQEVHRRMQLWVSSTRFM